MEKQRSKNIVYKTGGLFLMLLVIAYGVRAQDNSKTSVETTVSTQTQTQSQPPRSSDMQSGSPRAGIKGGLNVSNLITDDVNDNNTKVGFHVGVYGQLFSTDAFAIQPEVNYSTKGNKVIFSEGVIDQETKFNLNYLDVPVLAVFKLGQVLEIHAGPYWAYLVGANIDTDGDLGEDFAELDRDNFEAWDYGLVGGVGLNLGGAQLGARYNYGLNDIAKSNGAKRWLGESKNSVGQVYLSVNLAR